MSENTSRLSTALADRYRIERRLGEGGMATVYLAEDLKHKRKVAVKVLRPELAAVLGGERFVQEITTTANLQHPHILPLFDSGTADSFLFYVMPFIDGETLRDKLDRETQLGVDEAVRIAREVADALDYAHRNGIIHRDIKPENILLHDGRPMVADFGIALAVSAAAGGRMTETGLSLGTPHYMSPEQATAEKEITNRSDIYSVGSVLYEMLTGSPPHVGATAQQIIMKIVTEEASPITKARKSVPSNIVAAVARSLEKLPADRFSTAKEFAEALANPAFTHGAGGGAVGGPPVHPYTRTPATTILALATIIALALAAWGWLRPEPTPPVTRYGLDLSPAPLAAPCCAVPTPAPDGSYLVYHGPVGQFASRYQLWIKRRDSQSATTIPGTQGASSFAISPDGEWIAFVVNRALKKVQIVGGVALTLVEDGVAGDFGVAWLENETIIYVESARSRSYFQLGQVAANGGEPGTIFSNDTLLAGFPVALPGGRGVLFWGCSTGGTGCSVWTLDLAEGNARRVISGGEDAQYVATGHVVYVQDFRLLAVPFDVRRLEVTGTPVALADSVADGFGQVRVSRSGMMVVALGGAVGTSSRYDLVWVDRRGTVTAVDDGFVFQSTATAGNHGWALSPDGARLAIGLATESGDDIWIKDLSAGGTLSRLTTNPGSDFRPRWTADGSFVTFGSFRDVPGVYRRRADGTGTDSLLFAGSVDEGLLTPDGTRVLLREGPAGVGAGGRDISGFRPGVDSAAVPVLATEFDEEAITLSPDGRWLAYQSDETGRTEVFVRPFPDVDSGKWQVSNGGGQAPLWSRDGSELFYLGGGENMMAATVTTRGGFAVSQPQALFRVPEELLAIQSDYYTPWDVAPDGRFIMARLGDATAEDGMIVVVENWFQELRERME